MNIEPPPDTKETRTVAAQATAEIARKFRARQRVPPGWLGYNAVGLVGWFVVLPVLATMTLGRWLDAHHPEDFSWMLALPFAAFLFGSVAVAYWALAGKRAAGRRGRPRGSARRAARSSARRP